LLLGSTGTNEVGLIYTGQGSTTDRNISLTLAMGVNLSSIGSGALVWNGNIGTSFASTHTVTLSGTNSSENRFGGVISDSTNAGQATSLVKAGSGVWNLSGANTNTGSITVLDGLLRLDFAEASAPSSNILSASSPLAMRGGTLAVRGKASGSTSQTFNGLSLTSGQSKILVDGNGGAGTTLDVGTVGRSGAGAVVEVSLASTGAFQTSYTTTTNGVLSSGDVAFATVNGSDWATVSGGNVVALASYQTSNNPADWAATDNVSLTGSVSSNVGNQTINTLRMGQASNLTIGGSNIMTVGAGGVLFTGTANNLITGGTLRGSGGAVRELVVFQNQTGGTAEIASNIANNVSATAFTKAGAGTLTLSGNNTFTGNLTITDGVLRIASAGSYQNQYLVLSGGVLGLGAGDYTGAVQSLPAAGRVGFTNSGGFAAYGADRSVTLTGTLTWGSTGGFLGTNDALILGASDATAKVTWTSAVSLGGSSTQAVLREIRVNDGSAAVDAEISGVLSTTAATNHAGIIKTGTGTLNLSATNTYDGPTIVSAGTLLVTGSIGNSMLTTIESGATLAGNGTTAQIEVKAGGSIRPGNGGIGTLSTSQNGNSDFNWNGETSGTFAQMKFELSNVDATSDRLNLGSGLLLKAGGSVFRFDFLNTGLVNTTYTLISFGQSVGFNVSDFGYENLAQGLTGQFNLTPTSLTFTTAVVPEPLVIAPIMIGFLGLLVLHRRSRRKQQMI
jgi:fibronectin-binding autotransporter adhesin